MPAADGNISTIIAIRFADRPWNRSGFRGARPESHQRPRSMATHGERRLATPLNLPNDQPLGKSVRPA